MISRRFAAFRRVLVRFADAVDRRPEDDLRDDIARLARRLEALETGRAADGRPA